MFRARCVIASLSALAAASSAFAGGDLITVTGPAGLMASAEFTIINPTTLQIKLKNLSTGVPMGFSNSDQVLTGVSWDFGLPGANVNDPTITGGTVFTGATSASINFSITNVGANANVSGEWGYGNSPSGASLQNFFSALQAGSTPFGGANLDSTTNLDGPQGGLVPKPNPIVALGGLGVIQDEVVATLTLSKSISNLEFLYTNLVRFEFGSDAAFVTNPTPGASALLLIGGVMAGRRRRN